MPAYAETGTSVVLHGLRMLPMRSGGDAGKELKAGRLQLTPGTASWKGAASRSQPVPAVDRRRGHRGYPVRMSDWPLSPQEVRACPG